MRFNLHRQQVLVLVLGLILIHDGSTLVWSDLLAILDSLKDGLAC